MMISNAIGFLEMMGQDASLRHASSGQLESALVAAQVDEKVRQAVTGNDPLLGSLVGAPAIVCCGLLPSREDEDGEEEPSREDEEVRMHAAIRSVA